jgi:hypothetical protein
MTDYSRRTQAELVTLLQQEDAELAHEKADHDVTRRQLAQQIAECDTASSSGL